MGNHEWCEDCETSSFHHGQPCDPAKKAAVDKRKQIEEEQYTENTAIRDIIFKYLELCGVYSYVGLNGSLVIPINSMPGLERCLDGNR